MHRFLIAVLAGCVAAPAIAAPIERRYTITDFDRIQVDGPYQVTVATGTASSARASGSREAIDRVQVDVQGSMLRVRPNPSAWGGDFSKRNDPLVIHVTTRSLHTARVNGSGSLAIDRIKGLKFDSGVSGSGQISVAAAEADVLRLTLVGSGTIRLGGRAKTVRAEFHGSGNLEAEGLTASDAQIVSDTAGTMKLGVSRSASITASSSGEVEVTGTTACTVKQIGSGRVSCQRR
jgi:hypothetical protein